MTTHVNIALVIKFINNYFFNPEKFPTVPKRNEPADDSYLFRQKAGKLASVRFPDYRLAYEEVQIPNVTVFKEQIELFRSFLEQASPNPEQLKNIDYMLALGEMFTLIVTLTPGTVQSLWENEVKPLQPGFPRSHNEAGGATPKSV